jgi:hypothetical protein
LENLEFLSSRFFPPKSQLVMVSPLKPEDFKPLLRLRSMGYELMLISPNPISFELDAMEQPTTPEIKMAARLAQVERALLIRKLKRVGIVVIDWRIEKSLDQVIHQAVRQQQVGTRRLLAAR